MKQIHITTLLLLSFSPVWSQSQWQFIDCFTHPSMNPAGTGGNINAAQVQIDNFNMPWVGVGVQGSSVLYLGRPVNGIWDFFSIPVPDMMGFGSTGGGFKSIVFDDNNVPWCLIQDDMSMATELVRVTEQSIVEIPDMLNASSIYKFPADPNIYISKGNGVFRMSTSPPFGITQIHGQSMTYLDMNANGDLFLMGYDSPYIITRIDPLGNTQVFQIDGVSPSADLIDMKISSNGEIWLYFRGVSQYFIYRYDFVGIQEFAYPEGGLLPPLLSLESSNLVIDSQNRGWFMEYSSLIEFNGNSISQHEINGLPEIGDQSPFLGARTFLRSDGLDNLWYVGRQTDPTNAQYGLVLVNPYGLNANLTGTTFIDWNQNGILDMGDHPVSLPVQVSSGFAMAGSDGIYHVLGIADNPLTISAIVPEHFALTTVGSHLFTLPDSPTGGYDFGFYPTATVHDLSVTMASSACRPGFPVNQWVNYANSGTVISDGQVRYQFDPQLTFHTSTPPPSSVDGNELHWDFQGLQPWSHGTVHILFSLDSTASIEDTLQGMINVLPVADDLTPYDNTFHAMNPITGSYDPNDKLASPDGDTPPDSWIRYTVRFQNTGNDTAFTVRVLDTLSTHLDLSTLRILGYSHPTHYTLTGHILEFTFNDILLPDSTTNEPMSHGYFSYEARVREGLPLGTMIPNTAYIYFDFNLPIVTNTTENIIALHTGIGDLSTRGTLSIRPNPSDGDLAAVFNHPAPGRYTFLITDLSGRRIMSMAFRHDGRTVLKPETRLSPGVYLLTVEGEGVRTSAKAVTH